MYTVDTTYYLPLHYCTYSHIHSFSHFIFVVSTASLFRCLFCAWLLFPLFSHFLLNKYRNLCLDHCWLILVYSIPDVFSVIFHIYYYLRTVGKIMQDFAIDFLKRKSNILLGKFYLLLDSKLPSLGTCAWSQNRKMFPCLFGILITLYLEEKSTQQTSAY